jgi:outer membrane protein TolC
MQKLAHVEAAKTLMTGAMNWSVMKWLREKKNVRMAADRANAALDQLSDTLQQRWPAPVRAAYSALASSNGASHARQPASENDNEAWTLARALRAADDEAHRARIDAETTFDQAEKLLSTRLAREGCVKAIQSWDLKEKAIRKSERIPHG